MTSFSREHHLYHFEPGNSFVDLFVDQLIYLQASVSTYASIVSEYSDKGGSPDSRVDNNVEVSIQIQLFLHSQNLIAKNQEEIAFEYIIIFSFPTL